MHHIHVGVTGCRFPQPVVFARRPSKLATEYATAKMRAQLNLRADQRVQQTHIQHVAFRYCGLPCDM